MKNHNDVKAEFNNNTNRISLEKLVGKKVKEVQGHITYEFGDPTFQLYEIIFEDDSSCFVEGEHDCLYLTNLPNADEELDNIGKTRNGDEQ